MIQRKTPLKRTPLRPVSKKRSKELKTYSHARKLFLESNRGCQVELDAMGRVQSDVFAVQDGVAFVGTQDGYERISASCDIHHKAKRAGKNFLDESTWMAVCRASHEQIHQNPTWARSKGYLI